VTTAGQRGGESGGRTLPPVTGVPAPPRRPVSLECQRCGFPVASRAMGCKNPCANCGAVYPLGDCSD
jgi:hypothetical protein